MTLRSVLVRAVFVCGGILAATTPARAQIYVHGLAGATSAADWNGVFAGGLIFKVGVFEMDAEVGRMRNVLPGAILDRLEEIVGSQDLPVTARASIPATYGLVTFRAIAPSGLVQPFVGVGVGLARIEPTVSVELAGISLGDLFGLARLRPRTEGLLVGVAGLRFDFDRVLLEAAYRHHAIYADFSDDLEFVRGRTLLGFGSFYGGVGLKF
jgi:hypothetical protein